MLLRHPYANLELFCSLTQQLGAAPTGAAMLGGAAGPGTPPRGFSAPRPDGGLGGAGLPRLWGGTIARPGAKPIGL